MSAADCAARVDGASPTPTFTLRNSVLDLGSTIDEIGSTPCAILGVVADGNNLDSIIEGIIGIGSVLIHLLTVRYAAIVAVRVVRVRVGLVDFLRVRQGVAFTLAIDHDHRLFTDAFAQRIVIVSPTTLMMTLRIINNVWRYEKQNRNAQEIAQRAGALYDKLRVPVDEMETLGKQLATAERTYSSVYAKLATGKANLVRQVERFRELGATVKKPMPDKLVDRALEEE